MNVKSDLFDFHPPERPPSNPMPPIERRPPPN